MYELLKTEFFELYTGHKLGTIPNSDYECCLLQMVRTVLSPVRLHTGLYHGGRTHSAGGHRVLPPRCQAAGSFLRLVAEAQEMDRSELYANVGLDCYDILVCRHAAIISTVRQFRLWPAY